MHVSFALQGVFQILYQCTFCQREVIHNDIQKNIERSRDQYFARKKQEDQRMLEKKAREYFNNGWIMEKERELRDLQRKEDAATDEDVKPALQYMLTVTVEALKLKFQKEEVHGLAKLVMLERRKKVVEMQWVSPSQAERINFIWCPLPYPTLVKKWRMTTR